MQHAVYIGKDPMYSGEGALVRPSTSAGRILAQFDNMEKLFFQAHGWHDFAQDDFKLDPPVDFNE